MHNIKILLKTETGLVDIGKSQVDTNVGGSYREELQEGICDEKQKIFIQLVAKCATVCESYVYLYFVEEGDRKMLSHSFYFVDIGQTYDDNGYFSDIVVGEKLDIDNQAEAVKVFYERAIEIIREG